MYKAVYYFGPRWEKRIEVPKACQPGPDFSPDDCVINQEPKLVLFSPPLNKETFKTFLEDLSADGYPDEATDMREGIQIQ
jgi:hypothetical protein